MMDSFTLEIDDVRIVRALQIDPRVPFATMASVLGLSEPTISRRYGRLTRTGALRVTGVIDPGALGQSQLILRLRCRPGSVGAIAEALAQRADVSWVSLGTAGAEITCAVRSRSPEERADLLGRKLPRAAAVLDLEAAVLMRKFLGGRGRYWTALAGTLTADEEAALGSKGNPFVDSSVVATHARLDPHDETLAATLGADGRASLVELASAANLTPGRASRRVQSLLADGVVTLHVEVAAAALGYLARANLWLRVRPSELKTVARALAQLPEIGFVAAMSGRDNLYAVVHCQDLDELFEFTSVRVGTLPGVESAEISLIERQIKQAGTLLTGERLEHHAGAPRRTRAAAAKQ